MTAHLTADQLTHFKQVLLDEKTRLEAERASYADADRDESAEDESGEVSHSDSSDPADEATNLYDRDRDQAAIENFDRMLGKVGRALQKIEDGTYGLSDIDSRPIPVARLEALPYAVTTVDQEDQI
jgi:DnaK suppressor protein